jgi:hypothetical protein
MEECILKLEKVYKKKERKKELKVYHFSMGNSSPPPVLSARGTSIFCGSARDCIGGFVLLFAALNLIFMMICCHCCSVLR